MHLDKLLLIVVFSLVSIVNGAFAAGDPVKNIFSAGDVASASDVNDNFQELANRIAGNRSFQEQGLGPTFETATIKYDVSGTLYGENTTESRAVTLTAANGTQPRLLTIERTITTSGVVVTQDKLYYSVGSMGQWFTGRDISISKSVAVDNKFILDTPIPLRLPTMRIGGSFGGESTITKKGATDDANVIVGHVIQKVTLLGIGTVTVGSGSSASTYTNCSKIYRERHASIAIGDHTGIIWHCPGKGMVKATVIYNNVSSTTDGSTHVLTQTDFSSNVTNP